MDAGIYQARCEAARLTVSQSGNEQVMLSLIVGPTEQRITTYLSLTEKAAPYSIDKLRALGWVGDDISNLTGVDRNTVDVDISHEMYNGKLQVRVNIMTKRAAVALPANRTRALVDRIRAIANESAPINGAAEVSSSEEIPF